MVQRQRSDWRGFERVPVHAGGKQIPYENTPSQSRRHRSVCGRGERLQRRTSHGRVFGQSVRFIRISKYVGQLIALTKNDLKFSSRTWFVFYLFDLAGRHKLFRISAQRWMCGFYNDIFLFLKTLFRVNGNAPIFTYADASKDKRSALDDTLVLVIFFFKFRLFFDTKTKKSKFPESLRMAWNFHASLLRVQHVFLKSLSIFYRFGVAWNFKIC